MTASKSIWPTVFYATCFAGLACFVCSMFHGGWSRWCQAGGMGFTLACALISDRKLHVK